MDWLGRSWQDVCIILTQEKIDYTAEITYPQGKAVSCGNLRVVRVSEAEEKLKFILLHDKFKK